jgi:hypothetical protein
MLNSTVFLCSITAGRTISSYSIIPSSYYTYDILSISLGFTLQIYDYSYNDYLTLQFNSSNLGRQYFLAGPLIGITPNLTVNGVYCSFSIINDYTVKIILNNNVLLPSPNSASLII